jgi:hypothetical protein
MLDITPSKVPMVPTHYRDGEVAYDHDKALRPLEHGSYLPCHPRVCELLWMCTGPDIEYAINVTSKRETAPTELHMKQLKRMLRYLN